jgi:arylsulfatase A-like enzyme
MIGALAPAARAAFSAMLASAAALALELQADAAPPSVILLITDDQGYGDLSCHGNPILRTPHLDRLHAQSVRFTDFHVDPTCSPTRAALMTGRYSIRTGVWHTIQGRSLLRRDETTMAQVFRAGGYRTGIFGKWHLGDNHPYRPQERGFDESLIHGGGGVGQTPDRFGNDYFDDVYLRNGRAERVEGYCTDVWFREATKFIEAHRSRPFFCYLATNAPHAPYRVPERYLERFQRRRDVPEPSFYGMIECIDENVGRLLDRLESLGLARDTLFIFMTDNGSAAGFKDGIGFNAGMRGMKGSPYEGGHRAPFFLRWPAGGVVARDIDRMAAHVDVLPTLIDLCGLEAPAGVRFDGRSLAPLLAGAGAGEAWPERALVIDSQRVARPEKWRQSVVLAEGWRLVNGKELYDVRADPGQTMDLAASRPDRVARMRAAYEDWWADVSIRFEETCPIVLGNDAENPARLTAHDWHLEAGHRGQGPWDQEQIRAGVEVRGHWEVEVEREGDYEIALRRWPEERPGPLEAVRARVRIASSDASQDVAPGAEAAVFRLRLTAGKTRLETRLEDAQGRQRGAYFAYVLRLSGR